MGKMGRARSDAGLLGGALASYRNARNAGDEEDEAKWANNIGHMYKERGEYNHALEWFLKDYTISMKIHASDPVKLMPTCQSIGEAYLRLSKFQKALQWQRRHFHLAEEAADEPEQQRASTQLGRTYLEIFENRNTLSAIQDAKRYLSTSLNLAQTLKAFPPSKELSPSGFVKELVDAFNNLGLLRVAVDDYTAAEKYYLQGLKICDDEELSEIDDARSRLHHNLGRLYCELRQWDKAREHTDMDISICQRIPHAQGEAKGLMNQGDLHLRALEFDKARMSFKRALVIAQSLQDETQLCEDIQANISVVVEAEEKSKELDALLQQQKKLRRGVESAAYIRSARTIMKQEMKLLYDILAEAYAIKSWDVHLGMAKRLKSLAERLGDHEKLGDALDLIGISYYNLRVFSKAIKWHLKGWDVCHRIKHLEGQIVAKINLANALDSIGDWEGALEAYLDAYRAAESKGTPAMRSQKINALENIHYCYLVRLEQLEDARRVELELQQLNSAGEPPIVLDDTEDERCSETDGEGSGEDVNMAEILGVNRGCGPDTQRARPARTKPELDEHCDEDINMAEALGFSRDFGPDTQKHRPAQANLKLSGDSDDDDATLSSLLPDRKLLPLKDLCSNKPHRSSGLQKKEVPAKNASDTSKLDVKRSKVTPDEGMSNSRKHQSSRRKMSQTVLSDDEENITPTEHVKCPTATRKSGSEEASGYVEDSDNESNCDLMEVLAPRKKKSRLSLRNLPAKRMSPNNKRMSLDSDTSSLSRSQSSGTVKAESSLKEPVSSSAVLKTVLVDIPSKTTDTTGGESSAVKKGEGFTLLNLQDSSPGIDAGVHLKISDPWTRLDMPTEKVSSAFAETSVSEAGKESEWNRSGSSSYVNDPNMNLQHCDEIASTLHAQGAKLQLIPAELANIPVLLRYGEQCSASGVTPNSILIEKLQSLKISEDEVVASHCNLTDKCAWPFLTSLAENKTFTVLDLSHNQLGNAAVNHIQHLIDLTNQKDLGLTLDLHNNKLGAGSLTQICRCPVALSRLEVLNLSDNRLTDAASRHLSLILEGATALATLSVESCGLTTRSILKLTSALHPNSSLAKLCIGENRPIDGYALQDLLQKLSTLRSFAELDIKGLELDENALAGIATLLEKSRSISVLNLERTDFRNDGALILNEVLKTATTRLANLNLSGCGFDADPAVKLCTQLMSVHSLSSLDLSSNNLDEEGAMVVAEALSTSHCRLKYLNLSRCRIGKFGVLSIISSLRDNCTLLDLKLAENIPNDPASIPEPSSAKLPAVTYNAAEHKDRYFNTSQADDYFVHMNANSELQANILPLAEDGTQFLSHPRREEECFSTGRDSGRSPNCGERTSASAPPQSACTVGEESGRLMTTIVGQADDDTLPPSLSVERSQAENEADRKLKMAVCEDLCRRLVPLCYPAESHVSLDYLLDDEGDELWKPFVPTTTDEVQSHHPLHVFPDFQSEEATTFAASNSPVQAHVPLDNMPEVEGRYTDTRPACDLQEKGTVASTDIAGLASHPCSIIDAFCQFELGPSIRMARGLHRLDLSGNHFSGGQVEHLFHAWSASPRGRSMHQHHIENEIVHFFVQEQPCQCAEIPCCAAWTAT